MTRPKVLSYGGGLNSFAMLWLPGRGRTEAAAMEIA